MPKLKFLSRGLLALSAFLLVACSTQADDRPNILIIMSDDMGFSDPGFQGSEIETPQSGSIGRQRTHLYQFLQLRPLRTHAGQYLHRSLQSPGRLLRTRTGRARQQRLPLGTPRGSRVRHLHVRQMAFRKYPRQTATRPWLRSLVRLRRLLREFLGSQNLHSGVTGPETHRLHRGALPRHRCHN